MKLNRMLIAATLVICPALSLGDNDHDHGPPPPKNAQVDFGILPTGPLGPPPCLQTGAIGGPADPCSYKIHQLLPGEVTIGKGGEVSFQVHGGGHAMAIYPVSKNTTRDGIGQFLCAGVDPSTVSDPSGLNCNLSATNANAAHLVVDGKGKEVYVVQANATNQHPDNRVWAEPRRLMSAGAHQFLNGGTIPAGPTSNGQLVTYRFMKTGRYLVICMNRTHHLNDWMFGFVNVSDEDDD
jgi:hypothetical protein